MKLKRLAAATAALVMVLTVPAYANDADAVAVYEEMNQKQKTLTDVNAYYDFNISTKMDAMQMSSRLEMNMKANHITEPEHLRMNNYMRMTIGQFSTGNETAKLTSCMKASPSLCRPSIRMLCMVRSSLRCCWLSYFKK